MGKVEQFIDSALKRAKGATSPLSPYVGTQVIDVMQTYREKGGEELERMVNGRVSAFRVSLHALFGNFREVLQLSADPSATGMGKREYEKAPNQDVMPVQFSDELHDFHTFRLDDSTTAIRRSVLMRSKNLSMFTRGEYIAIQEYLSNDPTVLAALYELFERLEGILVAMHTDTAALLQQDERRVVLEHLQNVEYTSWAHQKTIAKYLAPCLVLTGLASKDEDVFSEMNGKRAARLLHRSGAYDHTIHLEGNCVSVTCPAKEFIQHVLTQGTESLRTIRAQVQKKT